MALPGLWADPFLCVHGARPVADCLSHALAGAGGMGVRRRSDSLSRLEVGLLRSVK